MARRPSAARRRPDMKRIALLGSAPSSVGLAPFKDISWTLWACSPGAYPTVGSQRIYQEGDAFFELHRWEPPVVGDAARQVSWFSPEYVQWLKQFKGPVYTGEKVNDLPTSVRIPREQLIAKYGPYFFTSSLAWMFAMALEDPEVEEIGMWGVDMSATEEYRWQRPGCQYFMTLAFGKGIIVTVPPESDLLHPQPLYGVDEWNPMNVKMLARQKELTARAQNAEQVAARANAELSFLRGAIDDNQYYINTFSAGGEVGRFIRMGKAIAEEPIFPTLPT